MARINGTAILLNMAGSPVAQVANATLDISFDTVDANDKDSGAWITKLEEGGYKSFELSFDGNASYLPGGNFKTLFDLLNARASVAFVWGPASGGVQATGNVMTNGLSLVANDEETATISGTAEGTGELIVGT